MTERVLFFTGFPGFIGRRLVERCLAEEPGSSAVCIVEPRFEFKAREIARSMGDASSEGNARVTVVVGDITKPDLALDSAAADDLHRRTTDVFHLAALYDLAVPEPLARRVNVHGTRHVLDFCRKLRNLRRLVYYSTCYVCGDRTGTFWEDELDLGQGFKNHYESTKHDAEFLVRRARSEVPSIIIRPSIVVGDSRSGQTQKFDGPYFGMILIDKLRLFRVPLPFLGQSGAEVNLVPVDYVLDATVALWRKEGIEGGTFAIADPHPMLARELYAGIVHGLGAMGPWGSVPPLFIEEPLRIAAVRRLLEVPREVLVYFNHEVHFDCMRALDALEGTGVRPPDMRSVLPLLIDYYKANKDRRDLRWDPA